MEARQTEFAKVQRAYKQDFVKRLDVSTSHLDISPVSGSWYENNRIAGNVRVIAR